MPAAMAVLAGTTAGVSAAARPDRRAQDAPTGWRRMPNDRAAATTHRPAAPNHAIVYCPVVSRITPATVAAIAAPIWCDANTQPKTIGPALPNARRHSAAVGGHVSHPVQTVD